MEIIIILIIIGIIGYLVFQNLPSTKFSLGCKLLSEKRYDEAIKVFENILNKDLEAPTKLATCFLEIGLINKDKSNDSVVWFQKIFDLKNRINSNYNRDSFELIEAKSYYEIILINFSNARKLSETSEKESIDKFKENIKFLDSTVKKGIENEYSSLKNNHYVELSKIYFNKGLRHEKNDNFKDAISEYSHSIHFQEKAFKGQSFYDVIARREICKLKIGEVLDYEKSSEILENISKATENIKIDFYYRYCLKSINQDNFIESIVEYLPSENSEVKVLQEYILNAKKLDARDKVQKINKQLELLFENQFPTKQTKQLYDNIDDIILSVIKVFPELKEKLDEIKPNLFNRLLVSFIDQREYKEAINLIIQFPKFWTIPELLKNLGICCFGLTNQEKLDEGNYKLIISSWLTSVHSDKVVLKSLDSTSWDDDFTFSLKETVGSNYQNHSQLPENANYEDVSETNISIGSTQRELINQYESLLNNNSDEALSKKAQEFYAKEKLALEKIIEIIPSDIILATPYFAIKFPTISNQIIRELCKEYIDNADENILEAGISYFKSKVTSPYGTNRITEYAEAYKIKSEFLSALRDLNTEKLLEINKNSGMKKVVNSYPQFCENFENEIFNFFNSIIENDDLNDKLIAPIAQSVNFFDKTNKLRYLYSNFVTDLTISKVNADKMNNYNALINLKNAYFCKRDIAKVCKNLITIIRMNLLDIINGRTKQEKEIFVLLDEIKKDKSQVYLNHSNELIKARKDLLSQFSAETRALILEGTNLNAEGLKIRKALTYLADLGNK